MIQSPITEFQVTAQVEAILRKDAGAHLIGIRVQGPWQGREAFTIQQRRCLVRYCASPLALREQLVALRDAEEITVLLTPLDDKSLGQDVRARLWRQKLCPIREWFIVRDLFRVDEIDACLHREDWMARALLQTHAMAGSPPVPGRVLTAEYAWHRLLTCFLGFAHPRVDAIDLARWARDPDRVAAYQQAPEEFRARLPQWLADSAGAVGGILLATLEQGHGLDLIPLGLVCQVLFAPEGEEGPGLATAATRLEERFLAGISLTPEVGRQWGAAVAAVVEADLARQECAAVWAFQRRAEEILDEIKASALVIHSPLLPKGLERRMECLAQAILESIGPGNRESPSLEQAARAVLEHRMTQVQQPDRGEKVRMAIRLVRWLAAAVASAPDESLQQAVLSHFTDGGFVDWARSRIWDGESNPALAQAYSQLARHVDAQREKENQTFGYLIEDWNQQPTPSPATLWSEEVLDQVVVPLAAASPVLLLVLDGMSVAVFRELIEDLNRQGWLELGWGENGERRPVIAALPTRTEVARASLLAGRLTAGDSADEKESFCTHEGLRRIGSRAYPPRLYHKGELTAAGGRGVAPEVRADLASRDRRVIGVVINTVDDQLAKGGQFRASWTTANIIPLAQILDAAREADRVIILTSDHGHILERDLEYRAHAECQERSRPAVGPPAPDEVILKGPRVWSMGEAMIAPWSEKVRYGTKEQGYHGGVSPQEVVVPLAVLHTGFRDAPAGWREVASTWPSWWEKMAENVPQPTPAPVVRKGGGRKKTVPAPGTDLFAAIEHTWDLPAPSSGKAQQEGGWRAALLASPIYQEQRKLCARTALEDAKVCRFLELLEARGGKMTRPALAMAMQIPRMRFPGLLAGLRRLLNVDGYAVLDVDDHADTVELNKPLLLVQFDIKDAS